MTHPFDDPEVDPSKGGRLLQRGQLAQRNLRVISIHRQQQHSARVSVQLVGQLQECHTIHAGQLQIGGDNGYLGALARQLLQDRKPGRRRIGGDDVVVRVKRRTSTASVALRACGSASTMTNTGRAGEAV